MPRRSRFVLFALFAMTLGLAAPLAAAATVWVEGEDARVKNVNRHSWYSSVKSAELSGGAWISHWSNNVGTVRYTVRIPQTAEYDFYVRANPAQASMEYRIDSGRWREVPLEHATDRRNVAADDAVDLRFVGWVDVGSVRLARGQHTVDFRMNSENNNHGAIDAFTFTTESFRPVGKQKPGEQGEIEVASEKGAWAFQYPQDRFTDEALLDLRFLNEEQSGQHGFIRLSEDGNGFVRGDGEPIRFWSVVGYGWRLSPEDMDRNARFLAKLGVNMIRIHANIAGTEEGERITDVNEEQVDKIWRFVKACKDNGIYLTISPYWYHHNMPASWESALPGYQKGDMPTGSLFFNPTFIDAYKGWVRYLYTETNPYTGVPLKDDPTVAIAQVKNEDSLLFWTSQRIPAPQVRILAAQFADWLEARYGSLQAAYEAWETEPITGGGGMMGELPDAPDQGRMGLYIVWEMTQPQTGGKAARLADQTAFLAHVQRSFYREIHEYLTDELGCQQLTNAMNWKSADPILLDDVERWTYTANDVIAVNDYTGGVHQGQNNGYRIDPGHKLINRSVLKNPLQMPTNLKQVEGAPIIITESSWVRPNLYQSEGGLMTAAYMSVTGVDSLYWFAQGEPDYMRDPRRLFWHVAEGETGYALDKWSCAMPTLQGMFPANALMYRLGYLKQGEPVVEEHRSLDELWRREKPIIAETANFDPNRDTRDLRYQDPENLDVSRLAFLVGPVKVNHDSDPTKTRVSDLSPYIDAQRQIVRSNTGEVELDWGEGVLTVDTPKAKGVAGFLKDAGGRFQLGDVIVQSDNDYAAVHVVAMDDKPLNESEKVLVQVGTTARLTGWTTKPTKLEQGNRMVDAKEIVATGKPPWQIPHTQATVTLTNAHLTRATLLDPAGYPQREVDLRRSGRRVIVELPENTMYLVLQ